MTPRDAARLWCVTRRVGRGWLTQLSPRSCPLALAGGPALGVPCVLLPRPPVTARDAVSPSGEAGAWAAWVGSSWEGFSGVGGSLGVSTEGEERITLEKWWECL